MTYFSLSIRRRSNTAIGKPMLSKAPLFRSFNLAVIQLGGIGADKSANLKHAREMIVKATSGGDSKPKPDLIVLPVRLGLSVSNDASHFGLMWPIILRNASIRHMDTLISLCMLRPSAIPLMSLTMCGKAQVRALGCFRLLRKKQGFG